MMDLKVMNAVLDQLEEERGIPREKVLDAIEQALATAYKKEYGKRGQIVRVHFNPETGEAEFEQIKIVVDKDQIIDEDEEEPESTPEEGDERIRFNPEQHILLEDARKIKKGAELEDEIIFPLETQEDYGRIAAQTAKQVIIQKIREAEKVSVSEEFSKREGEIVSGTVQRVERGNIFVDLGRATGILPYEEQIPTERFRQGERIRAYLQRVDETPRGVFLRLSRSHPDFLAKLFEGEAPEVANDIVEVKVIAREAGSRSKIAVETHDDHIDPVGSLVGQRGVRVSTVMSELGGEKIDIIEWSEDPTIFIEEALSPAKIVSVEIDEEEKRAVVTVTEDQQSLAIGKGGQNVRLAAKLTGWKIDIRSLEEDETSTDDSETEDDEESTDVDSTTGNEEGQVDNEGSDEESSDVQDTDADEVTEENETTEEDEENKESEESDSNDTQETEETDEEETEQEEEKEDE